MLDRLDKWLRGNALDVACGTSSSPHFIVSGGVLAWFVQEEQAASRSKKGGLSVPNALRNKLVWCATHLTLNLAVGAAAFVNIAATKDT